MTIETINADLLGYNFTNEAGERVAVSAALRTAEQKKVIALAGEYWSKYQAVPAEQRVVVVRELYEDLLQEANEPSNGVKRIYARTSTTDQNVQQQVDKLLSVWTDAVVYAEQESGASLANREAFAQLREEAQRGDSILVLSVSRLGRNTEDVLAFVREMKVKGVRVHVFDLGMLDVTSSTGKVVLTTLAAVAEMQREDMLDKQRIGIERAKGEGKYKGKQQSPKTVAKCKQALEYMERGLTKEAAANAAQVGIATLYRYIKASN